MGILEAAGTLIQAGMPGYTVGTNIRLGRMLNTPDVQIAVYEYGGSTPEETFGPAATAIDTPSLQVVCRAAAEDYPTARDLAVAIRALLGAVTDQTVGGVRILRIRPNGHPIPLGADANDRPRLSVNFDTWVEP